LLTSALSLIGIIVMMLTISWLLTIVIVLTCRQHRGGRADREANRGRSS